jgi:hypothetical protein
VDSHCKAYVKFLLVEKLIFFIFVKKRLYNLYAKWSVVDSHCKAYVKFLLVEKLIFFIFVKKRLYNLYAKWSVVDPHSKAYVNFFTGWKINIFYFCKKKIPINLCHADLHKWRLSYRISLMPSKENIHHFCSLIPGSSWPKSMRIHVDPDPHYWGQSLDKTGMDNF